MPLQIVSKSTGLLCISSMSAIRAVAAIIVSLRQRANRPDAIRPTGARVLAGWADRESARRSRRQWRLSSYPQDELLQDRRDTPAKRVRFQAGNPAAIAAGAQQSRARVQIRLSPKHARDAVPRNGASTAPRSVTRVSRTMGPRSYRRGRDRMRHPASSAVSRDRCR